MQISFHGDKLSFLINYLNNHIEIIISIIFLFRVFPKNSPNYFLISINMTSYNNGNLCLIMMIVHHLLIHRYYKNRPYSLSTEQSFTQWSLNCPSVWYHCRKFPMNDKAIVAIWFSHRLFPVKYGIFLNFHPVSLINQFAILPTMK